jgi:biopolymer transport protein TolQ
MNSQDMSILHLVLQASWVVQLVMLILVAASVASWATIFRKLQTLKRVRSLNDNFEQDFWSGTSLNDLYLSAQNAKTGGPMERIFASGMREYQKLRERRITMRHADGRHAPRHARELPARDGRGRIRPVLPGHRGLGLALRRPVRHRVGRDARLHRLCQHGADHAGHRGPRHCRSLVATAMGLFAAIPAVTAYNRYAHHIDRVASQQETFIEEFSNILQRNVSGGPEHGVGPLIGAAPCPQSALRQRPPHRQRNQYGALHRRDAGAAHHLHGDGAHAHARRHQRAQRRQVHQAADQNMAHVLIDKDGSVPQDAEWRTDRDAAGTGLAAASWQSGQPEDSAVMIRPTKACPTKPWSTPWANSKAGVKRGPGVKSAAGK